MEDTNLESIFKKGQEKYDLLEDYPNSKEDFSDKLNDALLTWEFCDLEVRRQVIFSKNEILDDILTGITNFIFRIFKILFTKLLYSKTPSKGKFRYFRISLWKID